MLPQTQFNRAFALFDAANAEDPHLDPQGQPKELVYAQRMSEMLQRFAPGASAAVQLACRAQHIQRWKIPRNTYPLTAAGYQRWRVALYQFHAERAADLMQQAGYDDAMIERVKKVISKRGIKTNPETQMMEDVANLVFIEHYLLGFAQQKPDYSEEKWSTILKKIWNKMSANAHTFVLAGNIHLPASLAPLILKAVAKP